MASHRFTVVVDGVDLQSDQGINALFSVGCDDATAGRVDGIQYLEFDRDAVTLDAAIQSAVTDLRRLDGLEVVRISSPTRGHGRPVNEGTNAFGNSRV
ncbi:MAG: hypothetical protein OXG44_16800 [Gammaproteobacteria bacterium]|nr:hypothetical protein [Gammaproteobacteria bacterium]